MSKEEYIDVELEILKINTDSIQVTDGRLKTFLPKSKILEKEPYDFKIGDSVELHIPMWLAEDRGLV